MASWLGYLNSPAAGRIFDWHRRDATIGPDLDERVCAAMG
jgi:hypothetical protein